MEHTYLFSGNNPEREMRLAGFSLGATPEPIMPDPEKVRAFDKKETNEVSEENPTEAAKENADTRQKAAENEVNKLNANTDKGEEVIDNNSGMGPGYPTEFLENQETNDVAVGQVSTDKIATDAGDGNGPGYPSEFLENTEEVVTGKIADENLVTDAGDGNGPGYPSELLGNNEEVVTGKIADENLVSDAGNGNGPGYPEELLNAQTPNPAPVAGPEEAPDATNIKKDINELTAERYGIGSELPEQPVVESQNPASTPEVAETPAEEGEEGNESTEQIEIDVTKLEAFWHRFDTWAEGKTMDEIVTRVSEVNVRAEGFMDKIRQEYLETGTEVSREQVLQALKKVEGVLLSRRFDTKDAKEGYLNLSFDITHGVSVDIQNAENQTLIDPENIPSPEADPNAPDLEEPPEGTDLKEFEPKTKGGMLLKALGESWAVMGDANASPEDRTAAREKFITSLTELFSAFMDKSFAEPLDENVEENPVETESNENEAEDAESEEGSDDAESEDESGAEDGEETPEEDNEDAEAIPEDIEQRKEQLKEAVVASSLLSEQSKNMVANAVMLEQTPDGKYVVKIDEGMLKGRFLKVAQREEAFTNSGLRLHDAPAKIRMSEPLDGASVRAVLDSLTLHFRTEEKLRGNYPHMDHADWTPEGDIVLDDGTKLVQNGVTGAGSHTKEGLLGTKGYSVEDGRVVWDIPMRSKQVYAGQGKWEYA